MPKQYCPSCGSGNEYTLTAPKFCNQCGSTFTSAVASVKPVAPARPKLVAYTEDDDDEPIQEVRIPRKLDVEWEVAPMERLSLASIMRGSEDKIVIDKRGKKLSKKAAAERLGEWRNKLQTTQRHEVGGSGGNE